DRLEMDLLRGEQRESGGEIEAHLPAERGQRAGPGAVTLPVPVIEHVTHEIEVGLHRTGIIAPSRAAAAGSPARPTPPRARKHSRPWRTPIRANCSRAGVRPSGR